MTIRNQAPRRQVLRRSYTGERGRAGGWLHELDCGHTQLLTRASYGDRLACTECLGAPSEAAPSPSWDEGIVLNCQIALARALHVDVPAVNVTVDADGEPLYAMVMLDPDDIRRLAG